MSVELPEQKIRFTIEADKQQDSLIEKLQEKEEENKELSNKLEQITSIEFSKQCMAVGLDPATATTDDLIIAQAERKMNKPAPTGQSETANVYALGQRGESYPSDSRGLPLEMCEFNSEEEMIKVLNRRARDGDEQSKKALSQLASKQFKGNRLLDVEFQGSSKDFLRAEPIILESDNEEIRRLKQAKIDRLRANRVNWKSVNDY